MSKSIQAIRGMNDLLPDVIDDWQQVEAIAKSVFSAYGYREIRFPVVEKTELFARSIGEVSDIVEKEMYTFEDRNGDSLSLRPEGTASCVRAGIESGILHNRIQRLWYQGPMFRHERPQKGRYRQFHQIGAEAFGLSGPEIDAELILITNRLWQDLGVKQKLQLEINTLGDTIERARYRDALVTYMQDHIDEIDDDSTRRLEKNPLRILDSKEPSMQKVINNAPKLMDHLGDSAKQHFHSVLAHLDQSGIDYTINPRLVRGLDYYCQTVFEWVTEELGAQGTVCAGGRYDGLIEQLGGKATEAAGFAIGMERLISLYANSENKAEPDTPHVYIILLGDAAKHAGVRLAEELRDNGIRVICNYSSGSMKSQMKHADQSNATFAIIIGDDELARKSVVLKYLRADKPQEDINMDKISENLAALID